MKAWQVDGRRSASGLYRPAGRPRPAGDGVWLGRRVRLPVYQSHVERI